MTTRNWQNITDYMDTVGTTLKTFTFPKTQNFVSVTIRGNANVTYTIGSQSGTLTPGQSISVSEKITSFTLTAVSGTQTVEVWATEDGTQKVEDDSSDSISGLAASLAERANLEISAKLPPVPLVGVLGGGNDDTTAFTNLINYCNSNGHTFVVPDDTYVISSPLPFPTYTKIKGNGYNTVFSLNLQSGQYCFYENTNWKYSWGIEGIRFTIKSGASNNVGAIYTSYGMRGCYIRDIWSFELYTPIYLGSNIWGNVELDNINLYLLSGNDVSNSIGINANGNTIQMSNIEIIGGFQTGLSLNNTTVFKLHGFNISGSSSSIQMGYPIKVTGCNSGSIHSGWIEQLDSVLWATNGSAQAINIKNSNDVVIQGINVATGSIFADNSSIHVDNIAYGQTNGGLRCLNNAIVTSTSKGIKLQNISADATKADGEIILLDKRTHAVGLLANPILKNGIFHYLTVTNGSFVTLTDELTDFISSDRAVTATVTSNFHGVSISAPAIVGKTYTAVFKCKVVSGVTSLQMAMQSGGSTSTIYPCCMQRTGATGYYLLYYVFTATATTVSVKLQATIDTTGGNTQAVFRVDSADIFSGYNPYDVSNFEEDTISGQGRFKNSAVPYAGKWLQGWRVRFSTISAGGYEYNICTTAGTANNQAWIASHSYIVGYQVNANGNVYQCTQAGTSGSTAPSGTGTGIVDGGCLWNYVDTLAVFKGLGVIQA